MLAPSSKNRQPWKFIVTAGAAKAESLDAMERGLAREEKAPLLPESAAHLSGARRTLEIMRSAPLVIYAVSELGEEVTAALSAEARVSEICNAQSMGAALENMSLTAVDLGLGSLWICDTFFAQAELRAWLNAGGELYAALALGYPAESPLPRPRKPLSAAAEWRV